MRRIPIGLTTVLATLALASSTFAATNANTLTGTVGPGFTITMNSKTVKAGTYVITIHDLASIHDFHLTGSGVDKKTSVTGTGTTKWTVKLKKGTYNFVCDPHHDHARRAQGHVTRPVNGNAGGWTAAPAPRRAARRRRSIRTKTQRIRPATDAACASDSHPPS